MSKVLGFGFFFFLLTTGNKLSQITIGCTAVAKNLAAYKRKYQQIM